jgi:hypothetical protein
MSDDQPRRKPAPYLAFATFTNALDNVAAHGVPNVIDRSSFPSFSGAAVAGTLSAFRFFGLISDEGKPLPSLHDLAVDKERRKENIRALLEKHYAPLIALDLSRSTPSEFDGAFSSETFNVSGDTRTKAKTFFLKAAQFADISISKLLLNKVRVSPSNKRSKRVKTNGVGERNTATGAVQQRYTPPTEGMKTIQLDSGGTLTLTATVNVLALTGRDRDFVFKLIDLLNGYEAGNGAKQVLP